MTKEAENWGGKRAGAGRPPSGRRRRGDLWATDEEWELIKKSANFIRKTKDEKLLEIFKNIIKNS